MMSPHAWIALALHLMAGFFYLLAGLLAPLYGVAFLQVLWLLLLWWLIRMRRERSKVLIVPATAAAAWFLILMLGDVFLGWTA